MTAAGTHSGRLTKRGRTFQFLDQLAGQGQLQRKDRREMLPGEFASEEGREAFCLRTGLGSLVVKSGTTSPRSCPWHLKWNQANWFMKESNMNVLCHFGKWGEDSWQTEKKI